MPHSTRKGGITADKVVHIPRDDREGMGTYNRVLHHFQRLVLLVADLPAQVRHDIAQQPRSPPHQPLLAHQEVAPVLDLRAFGEVCFGDAVCERGERVCTCGVGRSARSGEDSAASAGGAATAGCP